MKHFDGALLFALGLSLLLSALLAWLLAGLYRRRMLALMQTAPPPRDQDPQSEPPLHLLPARKPVVASLAANREAYRRLILGLAGLAVLIGLSQSALYLTVVVPELGWGTGRWLVLGVLYAWPMVLVWGLAMRWAWGWTLIVLTLYLALTAGIVLLRSTEAQTAHGVLNLILVTTALPVFGALLLSGSGRIRAVAPYLFPVLFLLIVSALLSIEASRVLLVERMPPPGWFIAVVDALGVWPTLAVVVLLPWLILAWPVYRVMAAISRAYQNKRYSDLMYLLAAYWGLVLALASLTAIAGEGWERGSVLLLPWLWLPAACLLARPWLRPRSAPSTLLVLRVFQRDAEVERLFDRVIERWRLTGNTLLIAGTDLLSRTLDPDDLFTFVNGRLAGRFVSDPAQLPLRLAELDLWPDPDGRYRINELYCHDSTWQPTLLALVERSDVVLMDLRGFHAKRLGCRFELRVLAGAEHLRRVVLLYDAITDRATAATDLSGASEGRVVWVQADRLGARKAREILASLSN